MKNRLYCENTWGYEPTPKFLTFIPYLKDEKISLINRRHRLLFPSHDFNCGRATA